MISTIESVRCAVVEMEKLIKWQKKKPDGFLACEDFTFASLEWFHAFQEELLQSLDAFVLYNTSCGDYPQTIRVYLSPYDYPYIPLQYSNVELSGSSQQNSKNGSPTPRSLRYERRVSSTST